MRFVDWGCASMGNANFRVHMVTAFYVTIFALLGEATAAEASILCVCFGLTMGAELMNTAIERLCDRQASGYDGFVRDAKDIAAAGVFVCAAACVAVGVCIFIGEGVPLPCSTFSRTYGSLWRCSRPRPLRCGLFFSMGECNESDYQNGGRFRGRPPECREIHPDQ